MIGTRFPRRGSAPRQRQDTREEQVMDSLTSGTFVGAGSFSCTRCGYSLTLEGSDILTECPGCGSREFVRASLFSTERISPGSEASEEASLVAPVPPKRAAQLA